MHRHRRGIHPPAALRPAGEKVHGGVASAACKQRKTVSKTGRVYITRARAPPPPFPPPPLREPPPAGGLAAAVAGKPARQRGDLGGPALPPDQRDRDQSGAGEV